LNEYDRLMSEIRVGERVWLVGASPCEPLDEAVESDRSVRNDPEHHVDRAAFVDRRVVRTPPEL
jgi:hypothetical protein